MMKITGGALMMKSFFKFISCLIMVLFIIHTPVLANDKKTDAVYTGHILYVRNGNLYYANPDGTSEEKIADNVKGQVLQSPDGRMIAYISGNAIHVNKFADNTGEEVYSFEEGENFNLYAWPPQPGKTFIFRRINKDGAQDFFTIDISNKHVKEIGSFFETPVISPRGMYWVYSTYKPGKEKSEVFGGEIGQQGNYVYTGRISSVLGWDPDNEVVAYAVNDKIVLYHVESRQRQVMNVPFKDSRMVAFGFSSILYFNRRRGENVGDLMLFDPERGEQKEVIENKRDCILVTYNDKQDKFVVFVPSSENNPMGEGVLYLVDIRKGESKKLAADLGHRIFQEINMDNQWSPDGNHFVFENLTFKRSQLRRGEVWVTTNQEKSRKMMSDWKNYNEFAYPVWAKISR
jgi:Tol biopolymer transport system component